MPRRPHTSPQARALFSVLLDSPEQWRHGYDLIRATGIKSGTLYPLLMRLAEDELLESQWNEPVPPARIPRHSYRLTAKGRHFGIRLATEPEGTAGQVRGIAS